MDDQDELVAALRTCATAPITLASLPSLSSSELALASLRPDLPALVRQRAYHAVAARHAAYQQLSPTQQPRDPLLDLALDFPVPSALKDLSLPHLLLLLFNPSTSSSAALVAEEASSLVLRSLLETDKRRRALRVSKACFRWEGGERFDDEEGMVVSVEADGWRLVMREGGGDGYRLDAAQLHEVLYIAGADDGHSSMECTLSLSLAQVALSPFVSVRDCIVRVELGMLAAEDEAFVVLREQVSEWARKGGFQVRVVRGDTSTNGIDSPPASPTDRQARSGSGPPPPPRPVPVPSNEHGLASSRRLSEQRSSPVDRPSSPAGNLDDVVWQYGSDRPAPVEWLPGFYARAFAFLSSLVPYDTLAAPVFTPAEIAILSFAPLFSALPDLTGKGLRRWSEARFDNEERLALEYLYKSGPPISLDAIRLVLLTPSYPSLVAYVRLLSKIVAARDALVRACNHVFVERLYFRLNDRSTYDPVADLIPVVEKIRDNVA